MLYSALVDTVKCIGCQGCQVACKSWNSMPAERTLLGPTMGNPADLDASTYTAIAFNELDRPAGVYWQFTKRQCMHCVTPACVSACPVGALVKEPKGPVSYRKALCIGCRYCMMACPFIIPKFEWDNALPYIRKCTFCAERIHAGEKPACIKACPSGALVFGRRDEIVALANERLASGKKYTGEVYGLTEAGGTSWIYITGTTAGEAGLVEGLPGGPVYAKVTDALHVSPAVGIGAAAILSGLAFVIGRRNRNGETGEGEK